MIKPLKNVMFGLSLHLQFLSAYVWNTIFLILQILMHKFFNLKQLTQQNKL